MSIKNKHIIHLVLEGKYLCIKAVDPTPEKSTTNRNDVTCKNCLRQMNKIKKSYMFMDKNE